MPRRILAGAIKTFVLARHYLFSKVLEKFVFGSKGFEKNIFGSIISPLEMTINWDSELEFRALKVRSYFQELDNHSCSRLDLVRVGSSSDGGYFLPRNYTQIDGVISAGIGDDNNFEFQLANLGKNVLQFDPTILAPPLQHPNMKFVPRYVDRDFNLNDCFDLFSKAFGRDLEEALVKVDIEGSEWELFINSGVPTSKLEFLSRVHTLVIEFHGISQIRDLNKWEIIEESLDTILWHFKPVSISGNNCRPFFQMGGVPLIDVFEVTFVRRTDEYQPRVVETLNSPRNLPNRAGLMTQVFYSKTKEES